MTQVTFIIGVYEIAAGLGIIVWWARVYMAPSQVRGSAPSRSHLGAEILTASLLLLGGVTALAGRGTTPLSMAGLGRLLYATVNAAGDMIANRKVTGMVMGAEAVITGGLILYLASSLVSA
jgi:hypothetical protein